MNIHDNRWSDELGLPSDEDLRESAGLPDYETERKIKSELGLIDNIAEFNYVSVLLKQNRTRDARKVLSRIVPLSALEAGVKSLVFVKIHQKNHNYAAAAREVENALRIFPGSKLLEKFREFYLSKAG